MKRDPAAAAGRAVVLIVLAASASYLMLYLYRWEWQRAIIAGIFFLASLIVLATLVVLRRLESLQRGGPLQAPVYGTPSAGRPSATGPGQSGDDPPFPWLEPRSDYGVFIPILLGFGVMVGLLAAVVERLASFVGGGVGVRDPAPVDQAARTGLLGSRASKRVIMTALTAAVLIGAVVVLRALTMYVPDPPRPGDRIIGVTLTDRRIDAPVVDTTQAMVDYCVAATGAPIDRTQVRGTGTDTAVITLSPRPDASTQRRFNGCLEDAILERRLLKIDSVLDRAL